MRTRRFTLFIPLAIVLGLLVASSGSASPATVSASASQAADTEDDAAALPSRVANSINRAQLSLDATSVAIDSGDAVKSAASLKGLRLDIFRVDRTARAQLNAAPPPADEDADTEEGATTGPDSVVAALTFEQTAVTSMAGLFDAQKGAALDGLTSALFAAMNSRDKLLVNVIGLDPEGAGADFADVMADTVAGYDDEVANLTEALAADTLSAGGRKVLTAALNQSKATQAKVAAAFGGGE
jgi:hypothetical protein